MGAIGMGAGTGAIGGAIQGTIILPGWGTLIGAVVGAAIGAGTAALGTALSKPPDPGTRRGSDTITTTTNATTPVALAFGRNRAAGNIIAAGYFFYEPNPIRAQKDSIWRCNFILGICEGGPPPTTQGIAGPYVIQALKSGNYYPFGNVRVDGQLPHDVGLQYNMSTRRYFQYAYFPGTNEQQIPGFVLDPRRGFTMLPHIPWRNTQLLECFLFCGLQPRLCDVNLDFIAPDWTIRRSDSYVGESPPGNYGEQSLTAFYDSYSDSFCYTIASGARDTPWGLVFVGRQNFITSHVPPPSAVSDNITNAWYIGRHDVLVMQDPNDSSTFHIGYLGITADSSDWETFQPDPGYAVAIAQWHLDEAHGILHTFHQPESGAAYVMRWWLLTGRIERTNTDVTDSGYVGFVYSADFDRYLVMGSSALHVFDPISGATVQSSTVLSPSGVLGICISGTMVGAITTSGLNYLDLAQSASYGPYGSNATDTDKGHFGGIWSVHQNTFTGHVTIPKTGNDSNIALINFIPSVMEDIRDLNANGTSSLGQDPLNDAGVYAGGNNGNPEPDFQTFSYNAQTDWARDWSVHQTTIWYLNALEGTGSLAAALWATNVDEPNLDSKRWGGGLDPKYFNLGSFEGLHWYCTGGVKMANADGTYRQAERYKYEAMITEPKNLAQFNSDEVLICCQGWRSVVGGQMYVGVTKPGQWPLWHFNDKNINDKEGMSVTFIGRSTGINRVKVNYRDILTEYRHNFAQAQNHWDIQQRSLVQEATITADGCGRYGSAFLLAGAVLDQQRGGRRQTVHKMAHIGWMFNCTDPVEISHTQSAVSHMPARVIELKEEGDIIEFTCLEQVGPSFATGAVGVGSYAPNPNGSGIGGQPSPDVAEASGPTDGSIVWANAGAAYPQGAYSVRYLYGTYRPQTSLVDGVPVSTYYNAVYGFQIVSKIGGTTTVICNAPGLQVSSPGWPTPQDAEAANLDQVVQFTLSGDGAIGFQLPDNALALAGSGYTADETPTTPTFSVTPEPAVAVPPGQPDPASLPSTLTITHTSSDAFNAMACQECESYSGTTWDGVLTNEASTLLFYKVSLDPLSKIVFGNQAGASNPPIGIPGQNFSVNDTTGTMWMLQCIVSWSDALTNSPGGGWVMQFYCGSASGIIQTSHGSGPTGNPNPTANVSPTGAGVLVWEGELSDPTASTGGVGIYLRTLASSSANPTSVTTT